MPVRIHQRAFEKCRRLLGIAMCSTHRLVDDFVHQAQRFQPMCGDAQGISRFLRFVGSFPEDGCTALWADDGVDGILQHDYLIRYRNRQRTA